MARTAPADVRVDVIVQVGEGTAHRPIRCMKPAVVEQNDAVVVGQPETMSSASPSVSQGSNVPSALGLRGVRGSAIASPLQHSLPAPKIPAFQANGSCSRLRNRARLASPGCDIFHESDTR